MADRVYKLDHTYEDRKSDPNEFVRWLGIKNSGGMRPLMRRLRGGESAADLAALILVSRHVGGSGYNPWQDVIEHRQGRIYYWGDAKAHPTKVRDDFQGNRYLLAIRDAIGKERWSDVPPILHFSKEEKGTVRFNGLCVLADLRDAWFEDNGVRVLNYRATLDILPVERLDVRWLAGRRECDEVSRDSPEPWALYAKTGQYKRLVLWSGLVCSESQQLPERNSLGWRVLEDLHALEPIQAELVIVRAFERMEIAHNIVATPPTQDGGFDFHGSFELPPPLAYSISLKGEVKRYWPGKRKVGPKDVARLVARLRRGEHGVFVTTSCFTKRCQEEVLADQYPVELISGARLAGMLRHLGAVRDGRLLHTWAHPSNGL